MASVRPPLSAWAIRVAKSTAQTSSNSSASFVAPLRSGSAGETHTFARPVTNGSALAITSPEKRFLNCPNAVDPNRVHSRCNTRPMAQNTRSAAQSVEMNKQTLRTSEREKAVPTSN